MDLFFNRCFLLLAIFSLKNIQTDMMIVLDTEHNRVGIKRGDVTTFGSHREGNSITTASGKVFNPICELEVSLTGTPAHLMFENSIGADISQEQEAGKMGSGKRIIFGAGLDCIEK